MSTGKAWKFFSDRAGDYLIGATKRTDRIRVTEDVAASAAYPILTDPFMFRTRWEELRMDLLDDRWGRPKGPSRWRRRYGKTQGKVSFPLVDGGPYDNEGLNGLRSAKVDYAIVASADSPENEYTFKSGISSLYRMISVMHSRLEGVTRQHAHEITRGVDPTKVQQELIGLAGELRMIHPHLNGRHDRLLRIAKGLEELSEVGCASRNHQYKAMGPFYFIGKM